MNIKTDEIREITALTKQFKNVAKTHKQNEKS